MVLLGYLIRNHGRFYQVTDNDDLEHLGDRVREDCINLDIPFEEIEEITFDFEEVPEKRKEEILASYENKENPKYPTRSVLAFTVEAMKEYAITFLYYLGGCEITYGKSGYFKISSKGYYHYIGA